MKMDSMMEMLMDLSRRVKDTETQQRNWAVSPLASLTIRHPNRRSTPRQVTPSQDPDLSEEVRRRVAQRLQQLPLSEAATADEGSTSEEEQLTARQCRPLKSGMHCTGATMVIKRITWHHKVMYSTAGKTAAYEEL